METNLAYTNLVRANLSAANLKQSNFAGATMGGAILCDLDLSECCNLDKIHHIAPSSIGMDTLMKSKGNIPESFLRGTGSPDIV